MARRSLENTNAKPSMLKRPRIPVNRPIQCLSPDLVMTRWTSDRLCSGAATEMHARRPRPLALDGGDEPGTGTGNFEGVRRPGQARRIVNDAGISTLQLDHLAKALKGGAGADEVGGQLPAFGQGSHALAQQKHPRGQFVAEL